MCGAAKDVLDKGDDQYQNFNLTGKIVQTYDVIGKHLYEFKRREGDAMVPEIFILLVTFFEVQPHLLKTEGLFRVAATLDKLDELQIHL